MPWKVHYEPAAPRVKGKGRSADAGTLTATYTEADFVLVVTEKNFEPDDESSRNDFVARAQAELKTIKDAEEEMNNLLNAGGVPAA
jgi:hypothetical protein